MQILGCKDFLGSLMKLFWGQFVQFVEELLHGLCVAIVQVALGCRNGKALVIVVRNGYLTLQLSAYSI